MKAAATRPKFKEVRPENTRLKVREECRPKSKEVVTENSKPKYSNKAGLDNHGSKYTGLKPSPNMAETEMDNDGLKRGNDVNGSYRGTERKMGGSTTNAKISTERAKAEKQRRHNSTVNSGKSSLNCKSSSNSVLNTTPRLTNETHKKEPGVECRSFHDLNSRSCSNNIPSLNNETHNKGPKSAAGSNKGASQHHKTKDGWLSKAIGMESNEKNKHSNGIKAGNKKDNVSKKLFGSSVHSVQKSVKQKHSVEIKTKEQRAVNKSSVEIWEAGDRIKRLDAVVVSSPDQLKNQPKHSNMLGITIPCLASNASTPKDVSTSEKRINQALNMPKLPRPDQQNHVNKKLVNQIPKASTLSDISNIQEIGLTKRRKEAQETPIAAKKLKQEGSKKKSDVSSAAAASRYEARKNITVSIMFYLYNELRGDSDCVNPCIPMQTPEED